MPFWVSSPRRICVASRVSSLMSIAYCSQFVLWNIAWTLLSTSSARKLAFSTSSSIVFARSILGGSRPEEPSRSGTFCGDPRRLRRLAVAAATLVALSRSRIRARLLLSVRSSFSPDGLSALPTQFDNVTSYQGLGAFDLGQILPRRRLVKYRLDQV